MRVYKFLNADIARQVIAERRLKISTFADMNDTFELLGIELIAPGVRPDLLQYFQEFTVCNLRKKYGALCFSKRFRNPVLWAHYADKHAGIVLGFDFDTSPEVDLLRVKYVPQKRKRNVTSLLNQVLTARDENRGLSQEEAKAAEPLYKAILSTKFRHWSYEEEIRGFTELNVEEGGKYFLNFQKKLELAEVILGLKCCFEISRILADVSNYLQAIKISRAVASQSAFEILIDPSTTVVQKSGVFPGAVREKGSAQPAQHGANGGNCS